jgi:class I fructose-bisphosphate aldolase
MANLNISALLGKDADSLLTHKSKTIDKSQIHLPGPDFVERIFSQSSRNTQTLRSLQALFGTGRLANTGYLSILPIDQGIEHSAGASFAKESYLFRSGKYYKACH